MKTPLFGLGKWVQRALLPLRCALLVTSVMLFCFQFVPPTGQAELPSPPPEGGYLGGNTAVGTQALLDLTTGQDNTALGFRALGDNTEGNLNTAVGSTALRNNHLGNRNTATGVAALFDNSAGNNNTATGFHALELNKGNNQTATGSGALEQTTTGRNNIALGYEAGKKLTTGTNTIQIGNQGIAGEVGTIRIGGSDQTRTFIAGVRSAALAGGGPVVVNSSGQLGRATSSSRFKQDIKPIGNASEIIFELEPVSFRYKKQIDKKQTVQFGLLAEQVERINPDLVVPDREGKPYTVRYDAVNAMLLNEFLKQHRRIADVKSRVAQLTAFLDEEDSKIGIVNERLQPATTQHIADRRVTSGSLLP